MKKVAILGQSNLTEEATRNIILCNGFKTHAQTIIDCTIQFGFAPPGSLPVVKLIYALFFTPFRWIAIVIKYLSAKDHDFIFVPYPSYVDGWIGCLLGKKRKKKVIIDAFLGIYDTLVRDRGLFSPRSLVARCIWYYEKRFLSAADYILVDTELNAEMFQKDYCLSGTKIKTIPVGIDETLWRPAPFLKMSKFKVVFWCTFIPLHGAEVVARAAQLLEKENPHIEFLIIGTGQLSDQFDRLLKKLNLSNIKRIPRFIPLKAVYEYVRNSHCCLGVFGKTDKTDRVIPYKVYQALAVARPVVTALTTASKSVFTHQENAILVTPGDSESLANAILSLSQDTEWAMDIGRKGRALYENCLSCEIIHKKIGALIAEG